METLCPAGDSMFVHGTVGKRHYLEALLSIPTERIAVWRGARCVDLAARVWDLTQLRI